MSLVFSSAASADENFVAGLYLNPSNGAQYIVAGAPTGTGRTLWTMTSAHNTAVYFHAVWETGPAIGNSVLAGNSYITSYPGGYAAGRSYGVAGMGNVGWGGGSTIAASQSGSTLSVSRLAYDGSTSSSFNVILSAQAATSASLTEQFRPGIYRSYNGYGYLVSGSPSQFGRTQWTIVSMPDNPNHFNASWETGAAIGNMLLAGTAYATSYPGGYGSGRSYGRQGQNSIGWSTGSAIAAAQVDNTLSLSSLYYDGQTSSNLVLVRDRSAAGTTSSGSENFVPGYYRSAAGVRYLVTGSNSGGGRTMWTIGSVSSPVTFNATWLTGPAIGNVLLAGSSYTTSYPGGHGAGRSYGVVGRNSVGWSAGAKVAASQAGSTISLSSLYYDGLTNTQFVIVLETALAEGLGANTESFVAGTDYQDVLGNNFTVSGSGSSWSITATSGISFNANWITGPIGSNPLFSGSSYPASYPAGYGSGRSYGILGTNNISWSTGSGAAFAQTGNTISVSSLYYDGETNSSFQITKGGTGGVGGAGLFEFDASAYYVNKFDGTASIAIMRADGGTGAVSVTYSTSNGTAIAGTDYTAAAGAVVAWANGDTSRKLISVAIPPTASANRSFTLTLSGPVGGTIGAQSSATVTILDNTLSIVAPFGNPRVASDFNADGKADLVWREAAPSTGISWWMMSGNALTASNFHAVPSEWQIADVGDLDGDGRTDLVWRRSTDGAAYLWTLDGFGFKGFFDLGILPPATWTFVGTADLNGDGKSDILWRNVDGTLYGWLMNGGTIVQQGVIGNPGVTWQVMDLADMDGDGAADLVFRNSVSGQVYIWYMNGIAVTGGGGPGALDVAQWNLLGAADFNGDGKGDLLWRSNAGDTWVWIMNGSSLVSAASIGNPGVSWSVRSLGDFDGDGKTDIVWRHTDGTTYFWKMNGAAVSAFLPVPNPGGTWDIVAP